MGGVMGLSKPNLQHKNWLTVCKRLNKPLRFNFSLMITISRTTDPEQVAMLNEEVQNLHAQWHPEIFKPYNRKEVAETIKVFLNDPNCYAYVAMQDGVALGCAIFFLREAKENAFHYTIKSLYVDQVSVLKQYQRSGAGKLLLEQGEQLAKELSVSTIELDHWSANTVAAAYFRKNGYVLRKERLAKTVG